MSYQELISRMTTYVLATNAPSVSETLCDHIRGEVGAGDTVHAVNSQEGGTNTGADEIRQGKEALRAVEEALGDVATVETRQIVEGNTPAEDVLATAEAVGSDQLVIGIRRRSRTSRLLFGSVATDILLTSEVPMRVVPRE